MNKIVVLWAAAVCCVASAVPSAGQAQVDLETIKTVEQMRECCFGAKLSDDLFPLLQMQTSREKLRIVLLKTCVSPELQHELWDYSARPIQVSEQI